MITPALHELTHERLHERLREAREARLALQRHTPRYRRPRWRLHTGTLGHLIAMRRHAMR